MLDLKGDKSSNVSLLSAPGSSARFTPRALRAIPQSRTAHRYGARAIPVDSVFETDVDAVLIASSTDTHADLMDRAASAGKPSTARSPSISIWNGPSVRVGRSKERAYLS